MRKLNRQAVPAPESLTGPSVSVAREINEAKAYYAARIPWKSEYKSYSFQKYREHDVKQALRQLSNGKCAYCESDVGAVSSREVEHYRPKGGVTGEVKHPGYWWLAHDWDNLLPTCRGCNHTLRDFIVTPEMTPEQLEKLQASRSPRTEGKGNRFPIGGTRVWAPIQAGSGIVLDDEDPYLIDPCRKEPEPEFEWSWSRALSLVKPARRDDGSVSPYGQHTIDCCALNRCELVENRTKILNELRIQRQQIIDDLKVYAQDPDAIERILERASAMRRHCEPGRMYAGMAQAFVDDLLDELDKWLHQHQKDLLQEEKEPSHLEEVEDEQTAE